MMRADFCIRKDLVVFMAVILHKDYKVERDDYAAAGKVSSDIKQTLNSIGYDPKVMRRIAVASYESEINMLIHAYGGDITMDIMDDGGSFCSNDKFMGMLKDENTLGLKLNTDLIAFGYHTSKAFLSFGVAERAQVDAIVPKSMFQYVYDLENDLFTGFKEYNVRNERLNVNAYTELSFGYARQVGERLTIGGKAKMLLGYANIDLNVKKLDIEAYVLENKVDNVYPYSIIETDAQMALSGKGIELEYDANGCVDHVKMGEFGIGGYGAAVDFGFEF
jgi:hypothetical protein